MIGPAVACIGSGQVIGLPTDTVYGLGVDPFNDEAAARLYELKGRPEQKPIGVLVASVEQAGDLAELGEVGRSLAKRFWPGALTLIVRPRVVLADWVGDQQRRTLGIRVPDLPLTIELLTQTGPLAVTSANLSGGRETLSSAEARLVFGDKVAWYVEGTAPGGTASTVVDATGMTPRVVRSGPVSI